MARFMAFALILSLVPFSLAYGSATSIREAQDRHRLFVEQYNRVMRGSKVACAKALEYSETCLQFARKQPGWIELNSHAENAIQSFEEALAVNAMFPLPSNQMTSRMDQIRRQYLDLLIKSGRYCRYVEVGPKVLRAFLYSDIENYPFDSAKKGPKKRSKTAILNNQKYLINGLAEYLFSVRNCETLSQDSQWLHGTNSIANLVHETIAVYGGIGSALFVPGPSPKISGKAFLRSWINLLLDACGGMANTETSRCLWQRLSDLTPVKPPAHPWEVLLRSCGRVGLYSSQATAFQRGDRESFELQYNLLLKGIAVRRPR
jgi:hypothetical protein